MARIRLPMAILGTGIGAAAPTFQEVPGTYLPVTPGVSTPTGILAGVLLSNPALAAITVQVDVPDEDVTNGQLDPVKIKQRYPNHPLVVNHTIPGT